MLRRAGELEDRVHVDRRAVEVDGQDAADPVGQRPLHDLGGQQARHRVCVDHARSRTGEAHGLGGGDERVGRQDDLVAGADAERAQGEGERVGAGAHADGVLGLAVGGEVLLEGLDVMAHDEGARLGHRPDLGQQLLQQSRVVAVEAHERDGHRAGGRDHVRSRHAATFSIAIDGAELAARELLLERAAAAMVQAVDRALACDPCSRRSRPGSGRRRAAARRPCAARRAARRAPRGPSTSDRSRRRR